MEQFINGTIFHRDRNALDQQAAGVPGLVDAQATEGRLSASQFEGPQFQIEASGLNGIPYGIEVHNDNFDGTTITQLDGDLQFIRFEGGQRERVGIEPIWGKEIGINARTNEDLSPLFGLKDRDAEVRVFRTDSGSRVWTGYIVTDFFQDEPLTDLPGVELRAVDGLTTLENDSFGELVPDDVIGEDDSFISYTDLFTGILSTLYESPLDVEFAVEWYPDAGGALGPDNNPLEFTGPRPDIYFDSDEGAWRNQKFALEDALKSQGLEIRQAIIAGELTWLVAQPTALSASSVKTWRYAPDGTEASSSPFTRDLSLDLNGADTNRPIREFERRTKSVAVTHDHGPFENLISTPGFEEDRDWDLLSLGGGYSAERFNYQNSSNLPPATQNNQFFIGLELGFSSGVSFPLRQSAGKISGIPIRSAYKLGQSFKNFLNVFEGVDEFSVRLNIGQHFLTEEKRKIKQEALPGAGSLFVEEVDSKIPAGSVIPVTNDPVDDESKPAKSIIKLTEPAKPGDGELIGEISRKAKKDKVIRYPAWTTSPSFLPIAHWKTSDLFGPISILAPARLSDGTEIKGQINIRYGGPHPGKNTDARIFHAALDNVTLSLVRDGNEIKKTTRTATLNEGGKTVAGQTREIETLLSSGPSNENARRVKGLTPGDVGFETTDYGIGAGGGDLSLAGLHARERLRYLRQHLQRLQLTVFSREKSPNITGEEIVQFNGKTWRIAEFSSDPYFGEIQLTLIQHEDFGVD